VVHARNIRSRITIGIIGGLLLENCGTVEVTLTLIIAMQVQSIKQQIKHRTRTHSFRKIQSVCNANKILQEVENKS
jgi:hypothetical protein